METTSVTQAAMVSDAPLVSVVIPTFNRVQLLSETLESILNQTFRNFEIIIVDNMSEDGTEAYIKGLDDPYIRYFRNENNGVIAVNRNYGIRQARGTYVAFCDDDDIWMQEKLERQLYYFAKEGISCVATNYVPIGDVRIVKKTLVFPSGVDFKDFSYQEILLPFNPVISSSVIARRDYLLEENGFDESLDFRFIEDWELWLRLSRKGLIRILAKPLLQYRMYPKKDRDARQVTLNSLNIIYKQEDRGYIDSRTGRTARANCSLVIGRAFLELGDKHGMPYCWKALTDSSEISLRIRALFLLLLFLTPAFIRKEIIRLVYSVVATYHMGDQRK